MFTRTLFLALVLGAQVVLLGSTARAACPPAAGDLTSIYYVNGIRTTEAQAETALAELERRVRGRVGPYAAACLTFDLSYNPTAITGTGESVLEHLYNSGKDIAEAAGQNVTTFSRRFWTVLADVDIGPDWLAEPLSEAFLDSAASVDRTALYLTPELQGHVDKYEARIRDERRKVVVVGHSQGNFFANQSYFLLPDEYKESLGVVAVATFDSFVAGQALPYQYTTLHEDAYVQAVITAASQLPGGGCTLGEPWTRPLDILSMWPLCTNTGNEGKTQDPFGHNFLTAYLVSGSKSEGQILDAIVSTMNGLAKPPTAFEILDDVEIRPDLGLTKAIRSTPGGTIVGNQPPGARGYVVDGPIYEAGVLWWEVQFDTGVSGWVEEPFLKKGWSPSTAFAVGDAVAVVYDEVPVTGTPAGLTIVEREFGEGGSVIGGPQYVAGYWWWQVDFAADTNDGWVQEPYLTDAGTGPSTAFTVGDGVEVIYDGVRVTETPAGVTLVERGAGEGGRVIDGPRYAAGYWWWQVDFTADTNDGWVQDPYLKKVQLSTKFPLNDTGITTCSDATTNGLPCPVAGFPGQDGEFGRDVTHNDPSDGHAGFSFTKLDANGNPLAIQNGTWDESGSEAAGTKWSCVQDNVTGRIWEVKTDDGGLRDKDWTYSWYNPDASANGGFPGREHGEEYCFDAGRCDTHKYAADVNADGLCGANDWRLPSQFELLSIASNDRYSPAIDTGWFPNTGASWFWSSSPYAYNPLQAWGAYFGNGDIYHYTKDSAYHVRLVRGGQ